MVKLLKTTNSEVELDPADTFKVEYGLIEGYPGYCVGSNGIVWTCWKSKGGHEVGGFCTGGMVQGKKWKKLRQSRRGGMDAWSVQLSNNGKRKRFFVHRLVLFAFVGPCPEGMVSRHGPYGQSNNHLYNLSWGTQKQNIHDKERDGTRIYGVNHPNAKMTPETVREARADNARGVYVTILAKRYGVAQSTMDSIVKRKTWKDVI